MDTSAVRAIVEEVELGIRTQLGISHWSMVYEYGPCSNPKWQAACFRKVEYLYAEVTLNPAMFCDRKDVIKSLVHELGHIVLAPLDLYRDIMCQWLPEGPAVKVESSAWTHAIETVNVQLERVLCKLLPETREPQALRPAPSPATESKD